MGSSRGVAWGVAGGHGQQLASHGIVVFEHRLRWQWLVQCGIAGHSHRTWGAVGTLQHCSFEHASGE